MSLRQIIKDISPAWKRTGIFEKFDYACQFAADMLVDKLNQAILARLPTHTRTPTSLALIGADRDIPRGYNEATSSYAIRLKRAFDEWFFAGSACGVMTQVLGYLSPVTPKILTVNRYSAWDYYAANTVIPSVPVHVPTAYATYPVMNWNWDAVVRNGSWWLPYRWWQVFLIVDATGWCTAEDVWGVDVWGPNGAWGVNVESTVIDSIRMIIGQWKSGVCNWFIIALSQLPNPVAAAGDATLPDGNYGAWGKNSYDAGTGLTTRVAARNPNHRYCSGPVES